MKLVFAGMLLLASLSAMSADVCKIDLAKSQIVCTNTAAIDGLCYAGAASRLANSYRASLSLNETYAIKWFVENGYSVQGNGDVFIKN